MTAHNGKSPTPAGFTGGPFGIYTCTVCNAQMVRDEGGSTSGMTRHAKWHERNPGKEVGEGARRRFARAVREHRAELSRRGGQANRRTGEARHRIPPNAPAHTDAFGESRAALTMLREAVDDRRARRDGAVETMTRESLDVIIAAELLCRSLSQDIINARHTEG